MGCGHAKVAGFINVDLYPACNPDLVCDLEVLPWPWPDNSIEVVKFNHCLEHMGQNSRVFLGIMKELYRICKDGAQIEINVPHPRHDDFINDPTHVRIITPELLTLFDREQNDMWQMTGAANSPLAHYLDVNFKIKSAVSILAEPYASKFDKGEISAEAAQSMARDLNNVIREIRIVILALKATSNRTVAA